MSLQKLYQNEIKQHARNPIGNKLRFIPTHQAEGYNPSCGDELNIYLQIENTPTQQIINIGFDSDACAICTASASLLCEHSQEKNISQLKADTQLLTNALKSKAPLNIPALNCLINVAEHPSRINCALLPWDTLLQAALSASPSNKPSIDGRQ
ncbi:iron-sulfur cluster assembly scaffold protein [Aliikangiella sp. IMCC44359]|uniref:iron-sulfur cluster assembly scaffold protein n=1 Tax=Aliikangiella sp. IMCC44359 TaxID=3459125 RepID=UPI00403AF53B